MSVIEIVAITVSAFLFGVGMGALLLFVSIRNDLRKVISKEKEYYE